MFCSPAPPKISGSPTLMSGTPILVSGFLSSIFRIKSLSSSLTFGLKRGKEGDEERLLMVRASLYPALPPPSRWCHPSLVREQGGHTQGPGAGESSSASTQVSCSPESEVKQSPSGGRAHKDNGAPQVLDSPQGAEMVGIT